MNDLPQMSTPITEAHIDLVRYVLDAEWYGTSVEKKFAQLIADSEARAIALAVTMLTCTHHNDQQRADCPVCVVKKLRADCDYNHECINRLASATGTLGEKSEKVVEVALSTIDQLRAEVEHFKFLHQCESDSSVEAFARARRAEAELAAERARLDWLEKQDGGFCHIKWGEYQNYWGPAFPTKLRSAIDAAMKEGAK